MFALPPYLIVLLLFSALSFFFFGYGCLKAPLMVVEFERYGLSNYRSTVGYLQLLGASGLIAGLFYLPLAILSSLGLSLLMLLGVWVRFRIRDGFIKSMPALFYFLLNAYLAYTLIQIHNV